MYGTRGQDQEGIDIYARQSLSTKYRAYQCKREKRFSPAKIKDAVNLFLGGPWRDKTDFFVLCTQESLEPKKRALEFEKHAEALRRLGITFLPWDERQLSILLKGLPELVDDFFDREWVRKFCGPEAAERLGERLSKTAKTM
jgi:hypothetical protein